MIAGFAYILTNKNNSVLYIGGTKYLKERIVLHKEGRATRFTKRYSVNKLVYFEKFQDFQDAFAREKQLKNWHKEWKWNLIRESHPDLEDLFFEL